MQKRGSRSPLPLFIAAAVLLAIAFVIYLARRQPPTPAPAATQAPAADAAPPPLPADYDPVALLDRGERPLEIYLREPRHAPWASVVESVIGGQIRRDLQATMPDVRSVGLQCRTLSCLILIDAPAERQGPAVAVATFVTLGPLMASLGPTGKGWAQVLFITDGRMADPQKFVSWYRAVRKHHLQEVREEKRPNPFPVALDKIPAE